MELNDNKAGMQGLEKERINAIIRVASEGSRFYSHQKQRDARIKARIDEQAALLDSFTESDILEAECKMDKLAEELEARRDLTRSIVHLDMDAFYAAVEIRDRPDLRDKPVAVGSNSMLSTSNYVARRFGVRAAMPGFIGRKLCPDLIIIPCNFTKYTSVAKEVRAILYEYDPDFTPTSLDEAYLDLTDCLTNRRRENAQISIEEIVREIRERIQAKTSLTASAGISVNSMLAKVGSDRNKPNGQFYLPPDRASIQAFISALPVRKVPGIGGVTEKLLNGLGIQTCADLWNRRAVLSLLFSEISAGFFLRVALGLGSSEAWGRSTDEAERSGRKSISVERTIGETWKPEDLFALCDELCKMLAEDVARKDLKGSTVTVKLKTINFDVLTRAMSLDRAIASAEDLFAAAKVILTKEIGRCDPQPLRIRLMGVRLSNFVDQSASTHAASSESLLRFLRPIQHENQEKEEEDVLSQEIEVLPKKAENAPKTGFFARKVRELAAQSEECAKLDNEEEKPAAKLIQTHREISEVKNPSVSSSARIEEIDISSEPEESSPSCSMTYFCPVCNQEVIRCNDLLTFNAHLDQCLNRSLIGELVRDQDSVRVAAKRPAVAKSGGAKTRKIDQFFIRRH